MGADSGAGGTLSPVTARPAPRSPAQPRPAPRRGGTEHSAPSPPAPPSPAQPRPASPSAAQPHAGGRGHGSQFYVLEHGKDQLSLDPETERRVHGGPSTGCEIQGPNTDFQINFTPTAQTRMGPFLGDLRWVARFVLMSQIGASQIDAPIGSLFQKYVSSTFMVKMRIDLGS